MEEIYKQIAVELNVKPEQILTTVKMLDDGSTVPFIARYRKEATGALTDVQLRTLENRLGYLRDFNLRKQVILKNIKEQGKLNDKLEQLINGAQTKTEIEDLYLPFKPKKKTKGKTAIEAGLLPLADALLQDPCLDPEKQANQFINPEHKINTIKDALDGARYILIERFAEPAALIGKIRNFLWDYSLLKSTVMSGKEKDALKYKDYQNYQEKIKKIPSHRALAVLRGRRENLLQLSLTMQDDNETDIHPCQSMISEHWNIMNKNRAADSWLVNVVKWTWKIKILPQMETDLIATMRQNSEKVAIDVFSKNLKNILLAAPAGQKITLGLDPGLRTGVKIAVTDETGKFLEYDTIYPHAPQNRWNEALGQVIKIILRHKVELIAIGNGTASRETERFVNDLTKKFPKINLKKAIVNESGASVYSASELATKELPEMDVVFRGAVSIARRLQDPLAELVKIDPKSIGVGQYQHDVSQNQLGKALDFVVEDCVNAVGVDVNTASEPLLVKVAGLNSTLAKNIVHYRNKNGSFSSRKDFLKVDKMGAKSYEQSAAFLRIRNSKNPLDGSAVHPESYSVVKKIAANYSKDINEIIGDNKFLDSISATKFVDNNFGIITINDIITELKKPGRDPRPEFKTATFKEGIEQIEDLKQGMILEGIVSNVTNFGAFVDIGVHQDGLVHISSISRRFIKNPNDEVKTGDLVKVKVIEIDISRKRISLSMLLDETIDNKQPNNKKVNNKKVNNKQVNNNSTQNIHAKNTVKPDNKNKKTKGSFADLFANAKSIRQ